MLCSKCGYMMDAFDKECPRCHGEDDKESTAVAAPITASTAAGAPPPPQIATPTDNAEAEKAAQAAKNRGACCALGCLVPIILFLVLLSNTSPNKGSVDGEYVHASSNIWSGVKLYYGTGEDKHYGFEVLGGNDNYTDPITGQNFRGLKVRYPDGYEEWKDRNYIINGELYWVKADDPALKSQRWETYTF